MLAEEDSPQTLLEGTLSSAPDHWHWWKTKRYWALSTHLTAEKGSIWHLVLCRHWIKLIRKRCSWHWGGLLLPKMPDQDSYSIETWKLFFFSFFPLLWHWPGKIIPSSTSHRPLLSGVNFQAARSVIKDSNLSMMLGTHWSSLDQFIFYFQCHHKYDWPLLEIFYRVQLFFFLWLRHTVCGILV